jgi:hypothetical protein
LAGCAEGFSGAGGRGIGSLIGCAGDVLGTAGNGEGSLAGCAGGFSGAGGRGIGSLTGCAGGVLGTAGNGEGSLAGWAGGVLGGSAGRAGVVGGLAVGGLGSSTISQAGCLPSFFSPTGGLSQGRSTSKSVATTTTTAAVTSQAARPPVPLCASRGPWPEGSGAGQAGRPGGTGTVCVSLAVPCKGGMAGSGGSSSAATSGAPQFGQATGCPIAWSVSRRTYPQPQVIRVIGRSPRSEVKGRNGRRPWSRDGLTYHPAILPRVPRGRKEAARGTPPIRAS